MKKIYFTILMVFISVSSFAAGHVLAFNGIPETCSGSCNGLAMVYVSGGVGPFTYSWTGYPGATSNVLPGVCPGMYSVTVTDLNDMSTATINGVVPGAMPVNVNAFDASVCAGGCVLVNSNIYGGSPPYTFNWSPATYLSNNSIDNPVACPVSTMSYTLMVTDANGCTGVDVMTVSVTPAIAISVVESPTPCGSCNGSLDASISAGTPPYVYSWAGPSSFTSSVEDPSSLCAGNYTLTATDASGCSASAGGSVSNIGINVVLDSIEHINCNGNISGSIGVHATGGSGTYTWSWSNGVTVPVQSGLAPGIYSVTVNDGTGCSGFASFDLLYNNGFYPLLSSVNPNCGATGSIAATMIGGTPPYTYLWDDPSSQTTATATGLSAGNYQLIATDSLGCQTEAYALLTLNCFNFVKGRVYEDLNSNCIQDAGENGMAGKYVYVDGTYHYAYTNTLGDYTLLTTETNPLVMLNITPFSAPFYTPTCPATAAIPLTFTSAGDTILMADFGINLDPDYVNLGIHPGWSSSYPGSTKDYWICYYNASSLPKDATIRFVYDPALIFNSASFGGVHNASTHTIEWSYTNIPVSSSWDWSLRPIINFTVPASLSTTSSLTSYFEIVPTTTDDYPADNTLSNTEPVTGSHDPNSKEVSPAGVGLAGNISPLDTVLHYTIHFQNNGNDTAFTVIVRDTLSENLNALTVVPGASSHNYTFDMSFDGAMTFRFDNILLPDSIVDFEGSKGYFEYTVHIRSGMPIGTVIENTASIYFDFNEAIVTNTTVNTIAVSTSEDELMSTSSAVRVFPNPFTESATIEIIGDFELGSSFEMMNVLGEAVISKKISEKRFNVSRSDLPAGIYLYRITGTSSSSSHTGKVIIK
jgi:uncharacterized repeat protein (TIGR01451 family)